MSVLYILMITEVNEYMNMISKIQNYKMNCFKNLQNKFNLKNIIIFGLLFPLCWIVIYYYVIYKKKTLLEGFLFVSTFVSTFVSRGLVCLIKSLSSSFGTSFLFLPNEYLVYKSLTGLLVFVL